MSTQIKESWFLPFGPVEDVDLIKVAAFRKWREISEAECSEGTLLVRLENCFSVASRVTCTNPDYSQEDCTYWVRGVKESTQPCMLFVVRDGAIIAVKEVNRKNWEAVS